MTEAFAREKQRSIENEGMLQAANVYEGEVCVKPGDLVSEVKPPFDRSGHVIVTAPTVAE